MSTHATLDTVIIFTTRMEDLAAFYQQALELGEPELSPGHMGFRGLGAYFGFDQVEEVGGQPPGGVTLWFEVDDLEAAFERCVALGATVRYAPTEKPWGARLAALYDPDGNMLGLSQRANGPAA